MIKRFNYIDGKINKINSRYYYTHFKKKKLCQYPETSVSLSKQIILSANKRFCY